jgi:hypothetical protein
LRTLLDTDKVTNEWTTLNGITGRKFTDKATGASIFLPAAGYRYGSYGTLDLAGTLGVYWSSTQDYSTGGAYYLCFHSNSADTSYYIEIENDEVGSYGVDTYYGNPRNYGFSVRCVKAE